MSRESLMPAGEILKVHGLEGGLVIRISGLFYPLKEIPEFFFLQINGLPVPFSVDEAVAYGEGSYLVYFEDITSRDQALNYRGYKVLLESKYLSEDQERSGLENYTGYLFTDVTSGEKGQITGFVPVSGNPLYEVTVSGEKFLIPAVGTFIIQVDKGTKQITLRLPAGIFNFDNL